MPEPHSRNPPAAPQALLVAVDAGVETSSWLSAFPVLLRRIAHVYRMMAYACAHASDPQTEAQREIEVVATMRIGGPPMEFVASPGGPIIPAERVSADYFVDRDGGERLAQYFLSATPRRAPNEKATVPQAPRLPADRGPHDRTSREQYLTVAVGGTFDHLHLGHRLLLTAVALLAAARDGPDDGRRRRLIAGITGDELLRKKKFADYLEPWERRQEAVARFLNGIANRDAPFESVKRTDISSPGTDDRTAKYEFQGNVVLECVKIFDQYGPTATDGAIDALVVSSETRSGGKAVNEERDRRKLPELEIVEVDVLDAEAGRDADASQENFGNKISSTAIREQIARKTGHGHE